MSIKLSPDSIVAVAPDQVSCDLAGEAAILNLKTGIYFGLNEVGATVWNLLASPRSVAEICAALVERYDVEPERCMTDLKELLADLARNGLISIDSQVPA